MSRDNVEKYTLFDTLLDIKDLCGILKLRPIDVRKMIREGELPFAMKLAGSWRFNREDLNAWLNTQREKAQMQARNRLVFNRLKKKQETT